MRYATDGSRLTVLDHSDGLTDLEAFSLAYIIADGWRCIYPLSRGHLTAAEARAQMRRERGEPAETQEEADEAETVLAFAGLWSSR